MKPAGGIKLAVTAARRDDRRLQFAPVSIAPVQVASAERSDEIQLVTDAHGRMRYGVAPGAYRIRLDAGGETTVAVADGRWTTVRLRLP